METTLKIRLINQTEGSGTGCWSWLGHKSYNGYAVSTFGSRTDGTRKNKYVHRVMYEGYKGPIATGLVIDHLCRNRSCINPDHLEAVTPKVNSERGIWPSRKGRFSDKTHCKEGHLLEIVDIKNNWRGCRICKNKTASVWQKLNKPWRRRAGV